MPTAQLINALIEAPLNKLLSLDPLASDMLVKLAGKSIQVTIKELSIPFQFRFTEQQILLTNDDELTCDCLLACDISTLTELKDSSQITRLIKQDKLQLEGDIQLAQQFSELFKQLNIDWEEQLSQFTGDVVAHKLVHSAKQAKQHLQNVSEDIRVALSEYAVEERKLTPHKIQLIDFSDQVAELRSDTARLEARLSQLEQKISE